MKKAFRNLFMTCLMMILACMSFGAFQAGAYGLKQLNPQTDSITVQWEAEKNVQSYTVYVGTDYNANEIYTTLPATATSVTITGLPAGCNRYVKVSYDYVSPYSGRVSSSTVGSGEFATAPGKVTGVKQTKWWYFINNFDVSWDKQDGADGYEYRITDSNKKLFLQGKTTYNTNSLSVNKKVSNSMVYKVEVRAYATIEGLTYYGGWSDTCYCFTQPRIKSAKVSGSKLTVKWGKVNGATGYDVYVSTKKTSGYKKVASVGKKASSVTISKLKGKKLSSKKTYYVYIATKKKVKNRTYTSGRLYYWDTKSNGFGYFN